jgi:hypothetical protein
MEIWGWVIHRKEPEIESNERLKSFVAPNHDDGAISIHTAGPTSTYIDLEGTVRTEAELVNRYREMSLQPDVSKAINEIVNEAIVIDENKPIVDLVLEELNIPSNIKNAITVEFKNILDIIDFRRNGYDIFKRWYIDGRMYHHIIIDPLSPQEGIKELRYIDPRKIRKIRELNKKKDSRTGINLQTTRREYFLYNEMGFNYASKTVIANLNQVLRFQKILLYTQFLV